jgi:hypothetical protein
MNENFKIFEFQKKLLNDCDENTRSASGDNAKEKFAFYDAMALVNATAKMTDSRKIEDIAEKIKTEILEKYQTPEIAESYAKALVNVTDKIESAEICETIADNFKNEYLSQKKYQTEEIYNSYGIIINNIAESMETSDEILNIADRYYNDILSNLEYRTKNIEKWYLDILNLAAKKSPNGINDPEIRKRLKYPELQTAFVEKYGLEYTITPLP